MTLSKQIGTILYNLRNDHEPWLSQKALGKALHMPQEKISRLERGVNAPDVEDLRLYCEYFHVSADYLLGLPQGLPHPKR